MYESHLMDSCPDIALLHQLVPRRDWQQSSRLAAAAVEWLGLHKQEQVHAMTLDMYQRLRMLANRNIIEKKSGEKRDGGVEYRLAEHIEMRDIKLLTGGIDPTRAAPDEVLELDMSAHLRRVEFQPDRYLKANGMSAKVARAIEQCPSPWALGERMQTLHHLGRAAR